MNYPRLFHLVICVAIIPVAATTSQTNSYATLEAAYASSSSNFSTATPHYSISSRVSKKLPSYYSGLAIEVAISNFPLDRSDGIFRQYGNLHYDKHIDGWYSYLIIAEFSSKQAAITFMENIIKPNLPEARLIEYKEGNRKVVKI